VVGKLPLNGHPVGVGSFKPAGGSPFHRDFKERLKNENESAFLYKLQCCSLDVNDHKRLLIVITCYYLLLIQ
jgi:hypothetical protein